MSEKSKSEKDGGRFEMETREKMLDQWIVCNLRWGRFSCSVPEDPNHINTVSRDKIIEKLKDIAVHLSKDDWAELSEWVDIRYKNVQQNFETMIAIGLNVPKPAFMTRPSRWRQPCVYESSDSDEDWTPKLLVNNPTKVRTFKTCFKNEDTKKTGKENTRKNQKAPSQMASHSEEDKDEGFRGFTKDTASAMEETVSVQKINREMRTLICESEAHSECDKGICPGIKDFSKLFVFCIIEGVLMRKRCSTLISKSNKNFEYIDAKDEATSNWMRFDNCARKEEEQNLIAFQHCGKIYYRTCKPVPPRCELLVWYGDEYAKELGIKRTAMCMGKQEPNSKDSYQNPNCS
uniref:histone-lysine N-methyltransferase PRDM9-like n=1 Tax=Pristiophorus japonicus TaxID=55135 RepID=UPI00398E82BB